MSAFDCRPCKKAVPLFMSDIGFNESDFYLIFFIACSIGIVMMGFFCIVSELQSRRRLREFQSQPPPRTLSASGSLVDAGAKSPKARDD
jgi:hypothetical protein